MTLADLCTSLIERESVIHSFGATAGRDSALKQGVQQRITRTAQSLKTFTCRDLMTASGCSFSSAHNWLRANRGRTIVEIGPATVFGGHSAMVWRWQ